MRWLASVCTAFIAVAVSGCAIIEAEKDNRGGFLDKVADDLWMKADSKKMRALRALAIEASLARIAMISPKSAPDRTLLARRIGETTKRADVVRKCAFVQPLIAGQAAHEPCFFFDSVMVDYENALFDLALVALPIDDARNLLTRVTGGVASVAINPLELVQALLDIGREAFRVGRVVGAIYRDTLELEVQVWLASPGIEGEVAGLRSEYNRGNDDILAWRGHIAALRALGLEPVPDQRFIKQIYILLDYICGQIVTKTDPAYDDCRQPNIMQSVPTVVGAARPLFGPGPLVVRGGGGGGGGGGGSQSARDREREQALREELQTKSDELRKRREEQQALQKQLDEVRKNDQWAPYRATLCVTDEIGLGSKTQRALKLFQAGLNQRSADTIRNLPNDNEQTHLDLAAARFKTCGRGTTALPRNPFEVGLLMSGTLEDVNGVLRDALVKAKRTKPDIYSPGPSEAFDLNRAVRELRGFYGMPATNGMRSEELDDRVWTKARG